MANRKNILVAGAPRGGKTYWASKIAAQMAEAGASVLVYNPGRPSDWPNSFQGKLIDLEAHEKAGYSHMEWYTVQGAKQAYSLRQFPLDFRGKILTMQIADPAEERGFFETWAKNCGNSVLIIDDARTIFARVGVKKEMYPIFAKANHVGQESSIPAIREAGADVITIFHNIDQAPPDLFNYVNTYVLFQHLDPPRLDKVMEDQTAAQRLTQLATDLNSKPKYSNYIWDREQNRLFFNNPAK